MEKVTLQYRKYLTAILMSSDEKWSSSVMLQIKIVYHAIRLSFLICSMVFLPKKYNLFLIIRNISDQLKFRNINSSCFQFFAILTNVLYVLT